MIQEKREWVFDLDNTLYPASCNLFAEMEARMTAFVADLIDISESEAHELQKHYFVKYGTTLNGLMKVHGLEPDDFLEHVHDVDLSPLPSLPRLVEKIESLAGRKFVYTNGSHNHALRVIEKIGFRNSFNGIHALEDAQYVPKPDRIAVEAFLRRFDINPNRGVFFDDVPRNLLTAHELGFATVLIHSDVDWSHEPEEIRPAMKGDEYGDYIDYAADDIVSFLSENYFGDQCLADH